MYTHFGPREDIKRGSQAGLASKQASNRGGENELEVFWGGSMRLHAAQTTCARIVAKSAHPKGEHQQLGTWLLSSGPSCRDSTQCTRRRCSYLQDDLRKNVLRRDYRLYSATAFSCQVRLIAVVKVSHFALEVAMLNTHGFVIPARS